MKNRYHAGAFVYARENPLLKLTIRRAVEDLYFCITVNDPDKKEFVYFGYELLDIIHFDADQGSLPGGNAAPLFPLSYHRTYPLVLTNGVSRRPVND